MERSEACSFWGLSMQSLTQPMRTLPLAAIFITSLLRTACLADTVPVVPIPEPATYEVILNTPAGVQTQIGNSPESLTYSSTPTASLPFAAASAQAGPNDLGVYSGVGSISNGMAAGGAISAEALATDTLYLKDAPTTGYLSVAISVLGYNLNDATVGGAPDSFRILSPMHSIESLLGSGLIAVPQSPPLVVAEQFLEFRGFRYLLCLMFSLPTTPPYSGRNLRAPISAKPMGPPRAAHKAFSSIRLPSIRSPWRTQTVALSQEPQSLLLLELTTTPPRWGLRLSHQAFCCSGRA
jgi:hypothetical protein